MEIKAGWETWLAPSKENLHFVLSNLRVTLFNDQLLVSIHLSESLCAALIHILHCVCTALYVREGRPLFFDIVNVCVVNVAVAHAFRSSLE